MKHEIDVDGRWTEVTSFMFRAWGGPRRLNGCAYHGPVYFLGTETVARPYQELAERDAEGA